jgi:hypothetical protein
MTAVDIDSNPCLFVRMALTNRLRSIIVAKSLKEGAKSALVTSTATRAR